MRISLTMRMADQPGDVSNARGKGPAGERKGGRQPRAEKQQSGPAAQTGATLGDLFANARNLRK